MKTKIKIWACAATLMLTGGACSDYLDINQNPNNLPESLVQNVLPGAQIGIAFNVGNTIQNVSSLWVQHMAGTGTQTQFYDVYNVTANDFLNDWNSIYSTVLDDLAYMIEVGERDGNNVHAGYAKILMAYMYAVTTDMWGDVPYSEALNLESFLKPKYDQQESIYAGLIALLDEAKGDLTESNVLANSAGDVVYNGDLDKWTRLANSIKLKLYLQSRKQNAGVAKTQIDALISENKLINTNSGNFAVKFLSTSGAQNPIYQYTHLTRLNDMILSRRFYDSLTQKNDPRIPYYFTEISGNAYVTYDNGQHQSANYPGAGSPANIRNRSRWGEYVVGSGKTEETGEISGAGAAPIRMITSSMVNFWLAEAALMLGTQGDAAELFEQAMRDQFDDVASFTDAPATFLTTDAETYIEARKDEFIAAADGAGPGGKLNVLIREKWASSAGIAYESYNDYRRTGFPNLAVALNNQPGVPMVPYRLPYAQSEIQSNEANVPLQNYPDGILVRLWWMGN